MASSWGLLWLDCEKAYRKKKPSNGLSRHLPDDFMVSTSSFTSYSKQHYVYFVNYSPH